MSRTCWKILQCALLVWLCRDPGLELHAQKQSQPSRTRRSKKPTAPVSVSKPKPRLTDQSPVATTPQASLSSLQSPVAEARLQNGLKVLLQENHGTPLVSIGCWYKVGSKDDPAGAAGLSNLARMISLRDLDVYSIDQTGRLMRETGGQWNTMTLPDQTAFFETVPAAALEEVLKLEAARMALTAAAEVPFGGQRRRAAAEIIGREDNPKNLLDDQVAATALQRHPYRWPAVGWFPDIERISREDVTQHLRRHFVPNNAVLVMVGDFETGRALGLVEKHFGVIPRRPDSRRAESREPEPRGERRVRIANEGTTPYLQFAFQVPELLNDDFYAMLVVDALLTGSQGMRHWSNTMPAEAKGSSRLFQALVETGLALEIRSSIAPRRAPSLYQLTLTLPDMFQFQAAEEAVLEQLERLKSHEVTDVELAKSKNLLVSGEFLAQDSVAKRAFQLGYFESMASHQVLNEFEAKISRVTQNDLRRVAIRYFATNSRTVGAVVPAVRSKTVEVEILSDSNQGTESLPASGPPPPEPKELNVPTPSLQPVLTPGSVFDLRAPVSSLPGSSKSPPRAFAEIPTASLSIPKVLRKVLPNGVTLIAAQSQPGSTVTIRAGLRATVDGESTAQAGVAALVNAVLKRGLSAKSQAPLAAVFDFLGAEVSSEIDFGMSTTQVRGLSKDCAAFLEFLAEMLQPASFVPSEFDKVRDELLGKLRELGGQVGWAAEEALRERFYPAGHPLQTMPLGAVRTVENLTIADARDFYQRYYRPSHLTVTIVGDIAPEDALMAGEKAFGSWKVEAAGPLPSATRTMGRRTRIWPSEPAAREGSLVLAGIASLSADQPDYHAFLILNHILAGAPGGGRIGDRVLAGDAAIYDIQSEVSGGTPEQLFSLRLRAAPSDIDKATAIMREELGRIRDQGITEEESKLAKRTLISAWGVWMGSNDHLARMLQQMEVHGLGVDYLEKYPSLIEGVSKESLLDCARTRFDFDQGALVVVKPATVN